MKNNLLKFGWLFPLLLLLLAACGGGEAAPAPVISQAETDVLPVAGRPQLIEFYADW